MMQNLDFIKNKTFALFAILAIAIAVPATVFVAQQQQEIRQRAAEITVSYGSINGTVRNFINNVLIPGVTVSLVGTTRTTLTDGNGVWAMTNVPSGTQQLTYSKTGFVSKTASVTIPVGSSISFHIQLTPITTPTSTIAPPIQPTVSMTASASQVTVGGSVTLTAKVANLPTGARIMEYHWYPADGRTFAPSNYPFIATTQASYTMSYPKAGTFGTYVRAAVAPASGASYGIQSNSVNITVTSTPIATPTPTRPPTATPTNPPSGGYGDNILDLKDYNLWLSCYLKTNIGGCSRADLNDDGKNDTRSGAGANDPSNMQDYVWLITNMATQFGD